MLKFNNFNMFKKFGRKQLCNILPALRKNLSSSVVNIQTDEKTNTVISEQISEGKLDCVTEQIIVNPLEHEDFFEVKNMVTVRDLFNARVHLGHKLGTRNPYMVPYLHGNRLGVDIFDLEQTLPLLYEALNFTAHIAFRNGIVLFMGRNRQLMPFIEKTAKECGEYAHCQYWSGGTFTNSDYEFGAVTRLPDLCIFLNTLTSVFLPHSGIVSAAKMNIPSIGILDSNCDPCHITFPVPGNDDSSSAVKLYCKLFKEAILRGKAKREELSTSDSLQIERCK